MTTTPPMVEKVAMAICQAYLMGDTKSDPAYVAHMVDEQWELWANEAQAAIAAMREPSEGMVFDGAAAILKCEKGQHLRMTTASATFAAMIDQALTEEAK